MAHSLARKEVELVLGDYMAGVIIERQGVESEDNTRDILKQYTTCPSWLALRFKHTSYGFWKSAKTLSIRGARRKTQTEGNDFESGLSVMPASKKTRGI